MNIVNVIRNAYIYNKQVGRNRIYVCTDIHDTIAHANYSDEMPQVIETAMNALRKLNEFPEIVLILFSSSYNHLEYIEYFHKHGVKFKYFNENPEVLDTRTGDFSKKFFYNIMIDDKAGFEQSDWIDVVDAIRVYRTGFLEEELEQPQSCKFELDVYEGTERNYVIGYGYSNTGITGTLEYGPFLSKQSAIADQKNKMNEYIKREIKNTVFSYIYEVKIYL